MTNHGEFYINHTVHPSGGKDEAIQRDDAEPVWTNWRKCAQNIQLSSLTAYV